MSKNYLPDISVIVCAYNHDKWLERCVRSLTHQSNIKNKEFEVILVDDGSTDRTGEVLNNFLGIRNLKVIKNKKNIGLPASINKGILAARGRYIVRVDSDDYVSRNFLFLEKLYLDMNREFQAVATDYVEVDKYERPFRKVNCLEEEIACGVMFRKECLFDIGLYNEDFKMREGHELKKRFEEKFRIGRLEFPLYKYRKHENNRTNDIEIVEIYDRKLRGQR